jgi:hypothetical protein
MGVQGVLLTVWIFGKVGTRVSLADVGCKGAASRWVGVIGEGESVVAFRVSR